MAQIGDELSVTQSNVIAHHSGTSKSLQYDHTVPTVQAHFKFSMVPLYVYKYIICRRKITYIICNFTSACIEQYCTVTYQHIRRGVCHIKS